MKMIMTYGYDTETQEFFDPAELDDDELDCQATGIARGSSPNGAAWAVATMHGNSTLIHDEDQAVAGLAALAGRAAGPAASLIEAEHAPPPRCERPRGTRSHTRFCRHATQ
jgi:hypothetical protein